MEEMAGMVVGFFGKKYEHRYKRRYINLIKVIIQTYYNRRSKKDAGRVF